MKIYLIDTRLEGIEITPDNKEVFKKGGMIIAEADSENAIPIDY